MTETRSVSGAVERREANPVEARLRQFEGWYGHLTPSHMSARQLVELAVAQFRKSQDLHDAAMANPPSFYAAVAECARLGLVPGDTYHLTGRKDKTQPGGMTVVGMVDWKGEVELIHRTGMAEAVVCEVVRRGDHFRWVPNEMRVPEHHIQAGENDQVGLAGPADRGPLTGVYCYVRLVGGGITHPTVMHATEVKRHQDKSGTAKFWGVWTGPYPDETPGSWTAEMFRKTAIHRHADSVPKSPEYLVARAAQEAKVAAAAAGMPPEVARGLAALEEGDAPPPYDGNGGVPNAKTIAGAVEEHGGPPPKGQRGRDVKAINDLFREYDIGKARTRAVLTGALAAEEGKPLRPMGTAQLNTDQAARVCSILTAAVAAAKDSGQDVRAALITMACRADPQHADEHAADGRPDDDG